MSSALPPDPWHDPELRQLPSERPGRRTKRKLVLALVVAFVGHALTFSGCMALVSWLLPTPPPAPPPPGPEVVDTFFVKPPKRPAPEPPPDSTHRSTENANAESIGPNPPQAAGDMLPRDPGPSEPPPPREPERRIAHAEPEVRMEREVEPPPDSERATAQLQEDKRQRISEALSRLGGRQSHDWGSLAAPGEGDGSSGLGYDFGGSAFQIESTADVDWGPWSEKVRTIVKRNWYDVMPVAARVGMKGIVRVRFIVHRDGSLSDYELLDSSGIDPLDTAVNTAVHLSNPLPPLPLRETDDDTIRVTYTFIYSLRDEREIRAWQRQRWVEQRRQGAGG